MADVLFFVNGAGPYGRFAASSNGFPFGGSGVDVTLAPDCSQALVVYVEIDGSIVQCCGYFLMSKPVCED